MKKNISNCTDSKIYAKTRDLIEPIVKYTDKLNFAEAMACATLNLMDLSKTDAEAALDYFLVHLAEMQNAKYPYKPGEDWCWIASQEAANAYALRYNFEPYLCADSDKERNVAGMTLAFIGKQSTNTVGNQLSREFVVKTLDNVVQLFPELRSIRFHLILPDVYSCNSFETKKGENGLMACAVIEPGYKYTTPSTELFRALASVLSKLMMDANNGRLPEDAETIMGADCDDEADQFVFFIDGLAYALSERCWPANEEYDFAWRIKESYGDTTPEDWIDVVKRNLKRGATINA